MSNEIMDNKSSETSADYVYNTLLQDKAFRLKPLLKDIRKDYNNPSCDYIVRQCRGVRDFEGLLRDYTHLFILENDKVARYDEKLETGQETASRYFEEKLMQYNHPVAIGKLKKCVEKAPDDIRYFMETFYPEAEAEFNRYFLLRPHLFHVSEENIVSLAERECAEFFRKIVKQGEGVRFMSLRGNVAQAPDHIRKYINNQYPGTAFLNFLENNCDMFRLDSAGRVFLVK